MDLVFTCLLSIEIQLEACFKLLFIKKRRNNIGPNSSLHPCWFCILKFWVFFQFTQYLFFYSNKLIALVGVFKVPPKFKLLVINYDKSHLDLNNCHEIKANICEEISERINRKFEQRQWDLLMCEPEILMEATAGRSYCKSGAVCTAVQWPQTRLGWCNHSLKKKQLKPSKELPQHSSSWSKLSPDALLVGCQFMSMPGSLRRGFQTPLWGFRPLCGPSLALPLAGWVLKAHSCCSLTLLWSSSSLPWHSWLRAPISFLPWRVSWLPCLSCSWDFVFLLP